MGKFFNLLSHRGSLASFVSFPLAKSSPGSSESSLPNSDSASRCDRELRSDGTEGPSLFRWIDSLDSLVQSLRDPAGSAVSRLELSESHSSAEHPRSAPSGKAPASSLLCSERRASLRSLPRAPDCGREEMRLEWRSRRVRRL